MAPVLNPLQLESALRQQPPAPLYLIVGEEDLLRDRALTALKAAVLGTDGNEFNDVLFYGGEVSGGEIATSVSEAPVFAERRVVVVKTTEKLSARDGDLLLDCVRSPVDTTTLVFMSAKLDGRLKFSQTLTRTAVVIDCAPLREAQLPAWIANEAERMKLRVDEGATQLLKESCGGSLYGLRRELEKLASYVPSHRPITAADVHLLRGMDPGASVFDLATAIAESQPGRVLSILARNLDAGEAPLRILGSLAWQYRRLWKAKDMLANGGREGEVARTLRMDPGKVRSFLDRFSERHLHTAFGLFFEADEKLKGGSGSSARMVLEHVLWQLCKHVPPAKNEPLRRTPGTTKPGTVRIVSNVRTIKSRNRTEH